MLQTATAATTSVYLRTKRDHPNHNPAITMADIADINDLADYSEGELEQEEQDNLDVASKSEEPSKTYVCDSIQINIFFFCSFAACGHSSFVVINFRHWPFFPTVRRTPTRLSTPLLSRISSLNLSCCVLL